MNRKRQIFGERNLSGIAYTERIASGNLARRIFHINIVVVIFLRASNEIHRSTDGGTTFDDVTPPHLALPAGTHAYDVTIAADSSIYALAHPGLIRLPAL